MSNRCARGLLALTTVVSLLGQSTTSLDLSRQGRNADFSKYTFTRPIATGTTLPSSCQAGQLFFLLGAASGQSLYACAQTNTWGQVGAFTLPPADLATLGGVLVPANSGLLSSNGVISVVYGTGANTALQGSLLGQANGAASLDSTGSVPAFQLRNLGSAAFSAASSFDGAGAASSAVAALPTSGAAQAQPALISPTDWAVFNSKQGALGFAPENPANKGAANGYAALDSTGHVAAAQLPTIPLTLSQLSNDAGFVTSTQAASAAPVQSINGQTGAVSLAIPTKTSQLTNDAAYVSSSAVPSKVSQLSNDAGFITGTQAASAAPVQSINGQTGVVALAIPSKTSQLSNDAGFVTATQAISAAPVQSINGQTGAVALPIPSKTSQLSNDAGFVTGTQAASAAPVQSINGQTGTVSLAIPTKTSQLTNDAAYVTSSAVPSKVSQLANDAGFVTSTQAASAAPVQSINGQTGAVALAIPSKTSQLSNDAGFVTATQAISAAPVQSINGQTGAISLIIPSKTSQLTNDAAYITSSAVPAKVSQLSNDTGFVTATQAASVAPVQSINGQTGTVSLTIPSKTSQLTNDAAYITSSAVPSKVSQLSNDTGFVTATQAASAAPVQSINGQTGVIALTIPTKTSQLTNDAAYVTSTSVPSKVSQLSNDTGFVTATQAASTAPVQSINGQTGVVALTIPSKTSQLTNDAAYITSSAVPSKVSQLSNDTGFVTATQAASAAPVQSINGQTGTVALAIPSKTSQLTNDAAYVTSSSVPSKVSQLSNDTGFVTATQAASAAPVQSINGQTGTVALAIPSKTSQLTNDAAYVTSAALPSKVSQLTNDTGFVTAPQAASAAPVQSINGQTGTVSLAIPSKTSQLTNDAGFLTTAPVSSINGRTGAITLSTTDVSGLAASATTDTTNASNITAGILNANLLPSPAGAISGTYSQNVLRDLPSIRDLYGAYGDGTHDDTAALTACFTGTAPCHVTHGTYKWTNASGTPTAMTLNSPHVIFDQDACIVPVNTQYPLIKLVGADTNPHRIDNFCYRYSAPSSVRTAITVEFSGFTDLQIVNPRMYYGPSISLQISNSLRSTVTNALVIGSGQANSAYGADGIHCESCTDFVLNGANVWYTGDDGVATTNYNNSYAPGSTALITNVNVHYSGAACVRVEGISNAVVSNVTCQNTTGSGIVVDTGTLTTGIESRQGANNVLVSNVLADNIGTWNPKPAGNGYGLEIYGAGTDRVKVTGSRFSHCRSNGLFADADTGRVIVENTQFDDGYAGGISAFNQVLILRNVTTSRNAGKGFTYSGTGILEADNITSRDDNQDTRIGSPERAFEFSGAGAIIRVNGIRQIDSNGILDTDTLRLSGTKSANYPDNAAAIAVSGLTGTQMPKLTLLTDGAGTPKVANLEHSGFNLTGTPTFTLPTGAGVSLTGYLNTALQGVDVTLAAAGSGYTPSTSFLVALPAPATGNYYGPAAYLYVATNSLGSVSTLSWWVPAVKAISTATWNTVTLSGGGCTTGCATATVSIHSAATWPVNRAIFETNGETGTITNYQTFFATGSPSISIADSGTFLVQSSVAAPPMLGTWLGATVAASTTSYGGFGTSSLSATEAPLQNAISPSKTATNFCVVTTGAQPAGGSLTFTVRKNGVATTSAVSVSAGQAASKVCDSTHLVPFSNGDLLSIQVQNASTATSATLGGYSLVLQ